MIAVRNSPEGATFAVKIHPRAKRSAVTGVFGKGADSALKVSISAPALEGRANEALIEFFAELCRVPRSAVAVVSGAQSRNKVLRITGLRAEEVKQILEQFIQEK